MTDETNEVPESPEGSQTTTAAALSDVQAALDDAQAALDRAMAAEGEGEGEGESETPAA